MIFTLYYMYATFLQWWRLGNLRNKLMGTLNHQNALVVATSAAVFNVKNHQSLENLLFQNEERVACTVVPRRCINLTQWLSFPQDHKYFPIEINNSKPILKAPYSYVYLEAFLNSYMPHHTDVLQIENFGELVAWKVNDNFEVILKTDFDNLTKLVHCFSKDGVDINHELRLLKVETVDVEGSCTKVKYARKYSNDSRLKYSHAPIHWNNFVEDINSLYMAIREVKNPKIKIENGAPLEESRKVPVYEVKPIKKEGRKTLATQKAVDADSKHMLEVGSGDVKKSHSKSKERERSREHKPKDDKEQRAKSKDKEHKVKEAELKSQHKANTTKEKSIKSDPVKVTKENLESPLTEDTKPKAEVTANGTNGKSVVSKKHTTVIHRGALEAKYTKYSKKLNRHAKPPVVLVYADSAVAKDNVKLVLHDILNRERYTVYDLPPTTGSSPPWMDCTDLVVVCGNVTPTLTGQLLQYLISGGQLLCLCSDLLYSVLHTYATAEVREHELVRFSYGDWKRVKMMHHIFCYQASPARKQFSKDSDQSSNSNGSSPVAPRTPSTAEIQHNGKTYTVNVQVLGAEETWQTPSILLATVKNSHGKAIFSQVHLEVDPNQYEDDEYKFEALKESNQARLEILRNILSHHLDMDCLNTSLEPALTSGFFLGRHDLKLKLLQECESIVDNKLVTDKITVSFCGKDAEPGSATQTHLPVLIHSCPSNFSTVQYFESLETDEIGRLVIYADVMTSSHHVLARKLHHGLAVIPRIQIQGQGRSTNSWIGPSGSAMFSLQMHIHLESPLGKALPLVQHMVMAAVVSAIRTLPGYEKLGLGLKWPNDLYTTMGIKVGGLVVNSTIESGLAIVNIGCGVDLSNPNPTMSINELIRLHNEEYNTNLDIITYEKYFALVFNETERIFKVVQKGDIDYLYDLYYKYWLHSGAEITVTTKTGESRKAVITGLDDYGYLTVQSEDGTLSSVQPDGNSFDMLKGLIAPKIF